MRVALVGAAGTFGSVLAKRLGRSAAVDRLVLVGRSLDSLRGVDTGGTRAEHVALDVRDGPALAAALTAHGVDALVNTAVWDDPCVVEACLAARAHYVDLADDADWVCGFQDRFDAAARAAGVSLVAGASTVPGLSSAAAAALAADLAPESPVRHIDVVISPGNRLPRGLATVRSVLRYAGRRTGSGAVGWRRLQRETLPGLSPQRLVADVDVPDLRLLRQPDRAVAVAVRAGLELRPMMWALSALARLVERGWVRDASAWAEPLRRASLWVKGLGVDDGAMEVAVRGREPSQLRTWSLVACGGDGPNVPTVAARLLLPKLAGMPAGARPCVELFTLDEAEALMRSELDIAFYRDGPSRLGDAALAARAPGAPYARALGPYNMRQLPDFLRRFHGGAPEPVEGTLRVTRGRGWLRNLLCALGGLPRAAEAAHVRVDVSADSSAEVWTREFDGKKLVSRIRYERGLVLESFGPITFGFLMFPAADGSGFEHRTRRMWVLGVPVPRALALSGDGRTSLRADGEDGWELEVSVRAPLLGELVRYEGVMGRLAAAGGPAS